MDDTEDKQQHNEEHLSTNKQVKIQTEENANSVRTSKRTRKHKLHLTNKKKSSMEPTKSAGKGKCYGSPLMIKKLGTALRLNSHPMCNRYLDTVPVALRREAIQRGWMEDDHLTHTLDLEDDSDINVLCEAVYAATILRFSGRVSRFALFQKWNGNKERIFIPRKGQSTRDFLKFVKRTVMGNSGYGYAMSQWLSGQHFQAIPKTIRSHYSHFEGFVEKMEVGIEFCVRSMIEGFIKNKGKSEIDIRKEVINVLKGHIGGWCSDELKGDIGFLAQQIVADVEGLFGYVFGEPKATGIEAGHAGDLGYLMIVWKEAKKTRSTLAMVLQGIVDMIQKGGILEDSWLEVGGYVRCNESGKVVNKVNGLPFNVTDAEHWLCKSWVIVKKTFNHYRNSMYPVPLEPHYHPIKWPKHDTPTTITSDIVVDKIMEEITDKFESCAVAEDEEKSKEESKWESSFKLPEILVI